MLFLFSLTSSPPFTTLGSLNNGKIRCPWHGACFNLGTGDIEDFPGLDSIAKFQVPFFEFVQ